jgi:hypothetical protein
VIVYQFEARIENISLSISSKIPAQYAFSFKELSPLVILPKGFAFLREKPMRRQWLLPQERRTSIIPPLTSEITIRYNLNITNRYSPGLVQMMVNAFARLPVKKWRKTIVFRVGWCYDINGKGM